MNQKMTMWMMTTIEMTKIEMMTIEMIWHDNLENVSGALERIPRCNKGEPYRIPSDVMKMLGIPADVPKIFSNGVWLECDDVV